MSAAREQLGLPAGRKVGRYRLEKIHAAWGFYLTYLAEDTADGRAVAVHELVPEEFVTRAADGTLRGTSEKAQENLAWAAARFAREGRGLAGCAHPALQKVSEVIEANGTAYWVTPREEPRTLKSWLQETGRSPTEGELRALLTPLLGALEVAHAAALPHLGLKPDAIQMTAGGQPVLTHFCGARQAIARRCHEAAAVTDGYSAPEQYDLEKNADERADIYGLAAVLHRALTGQAPLDAEQRLANDTREPLAGRLAGRYHAGFLAAVDAALALDPAARPQSVLAWRKMLGLADGGGWRVFVGRSPRRVAAGAAVAVVALWFAFRPHPDDQPTDKTEHEEKQEAKDEKKTEEKKEKEPDAEKKEEQAKQEEQKKKAEEEQREKERKLAEEKETAAKAAMEKQAKDEAARLAEEAAKAAEKAEAAKRVAEEAARLAQAEKDAAKRIAVEKAAAQAAAEAAKAQAEAEKAQAKKQTAEASAQAAMEKRAQDEAARLAQAAAKAAEKAEAAKRAAEEAARQAQAEKDAAKKIAAEKAAAQAAADAAKAKEAAQAAAVEVKATKMTAALAEVQKASAAEAAAAKALAEKAAAEKQAAEKAAAQKSAAAKAAAESAAREKAGAEKTAAEKSVAAAGSREQAARANADLKTLQAQFAAEKAAAEKAAAETAAKQARAAAANAGAAVPFGVLPDAQAMQARAAEAAQRAAAAQQAAQRMAQEKAAAEKLVEQAAAETAAVRKAQDSPKEGAAKSGGSDPNRDKYEHVESTENSKFAGNRSAGEIMGIWETVATDAQGKAERKLTVYGDGRYLISDNAGWEDRGDIYANIGFFQMRSDTTGNIILSKFKLRTLAGMNTTGALGSRDWKRTGIAPDEDPKKPAKK